MNLTKMTRILVQTWFIYFTEARMSDLQANSCKRLLIRAEYKHAIRQGTPGTTNEKAGNYMVEL